MNEIFYNLGMIAFYLLLAFFALQTMFFIYHWFKYGENARTSFTALSVYLIGGGVLFFTLFMLIQQL